MIQYLPAILAAIASVIGALVSLYGPNRSARIARDNRLRSLYGDIMKAIIDINAEAEDYYYNRLLPNETMLANDPEERMPNWAKATNADIAEKRTLMKAFNNARALLLVEPYTLVAPVIEAVDNYWFQAENEGWNAPLLKTATLNVQYAMGRSTYARSFWAQIHFWLVFKEPWTVYRMKRKQSEPRQKRKPTD